VRCDSFHTTRHHKLTKLSTASVDVSIAAAARTENNAATLWREKNCDEKINWMTFDVVAGTGGTPLPEQQPMVDGEVIAIAAAASSIATIPLKVPVIAQQSNDDRRTQRCTQQQTYDGLARHPPPRACKNI
jgi:hypothetical protein